MEKPGIFISHAHENKEFVRKLESELKSAGVDLWVDHSEVRGGDSISRRVSDALEWCDAVLLVWSEAASKSVWVEKEWGVANSMHKKIIPCVLDDTELPALLKDNASIDFRQFEQGLADLQRSLISVGQPSEPASVTDGALKQTGLSGARSQIWNIPYDRNPVFTGRDDLLSDIRRTFTAKKSTAPRFAIHGLGGVGKTQLAIEYAYRYNKEYDMVWWIRAEESTTLAADYADWRKS